MSVGVRLLELVMVATVIFLHVSVAVGGEIIVMVMVVVVHGTRMERWE